MNNDRTYKQYVENRVKKIRNNSTLKGWRHVAGTDNIADLPSRGCTPDQLDKRKDEWFHGPKWLLGEESTWPVRKAEELVMTEQQKSLVDKEEKKKEAKVKEKVVLLSKAEEVDLDEIIDPTRYSTLTKLLRITALCLKFIDRLKKKMVELDISAEDIEKAKDMWIRQLQSRMKKECKYQKTAESLGVKEDSQGYLRCMGRLGKSKLPFDTKHPLLLPTYQWVTTLLIRSCHEDVFHDGVKETLAQLRSKYWVVRGRQRVRAVINTQLLIIVDLSK